jgi:hypothetical protein
MDTPSSFSLILVLLIISSAKHALKKCQLTIQCTNTPYMISTPGGKIVTKQIFMHTPLNLAGKVYKLSLIILDGQGIDVILEMGWMKAHNALLDIAAHTVYLDSLVHCIATLWFPSPSVATPLVHRTTTQNLEDIPVAYEFPDVFPDDLPGMLPD